MGKVVLAMFTSLDGYIERPAGEFVPPPWSDEVEREWSGNALARAGHLLYGRTNFLFNKAFWSAADTDPGSPAAGISYAGTMNRLPKTVFSTTLSGDPGWNATLVRDDIAGAIAGLNPAPQPPGDEGHHRLAGRIEPLQVVDSDDHRGVPCQGLDDRKHGRRDHVLVRGRSPGDVAQKHPVHREALHVGQCGEHIGGDVAEDVGNGAVGHHRLCFPRPCGQHTPSPCAGLLQRGQPESRLADPRITLHEQAGGPGFRLGQKVSNRAELRRTTDNS